MESFPEMTNKVTTLVRATGIEDPGRMSGAGTERPDPEVAERARRRRFTAKYKLEILAAYDAAPDGEKGALLRREGLYSSHIVAWRRARDAGALAGLAVARGRKRRDPQADRIARLEQEIRELKRANEILKRAASFFGAELCATRRQMYREVVRDRLCWAVAATRVKRRGSRLPGTTVIGGKRPREGEPCRYCQTGRAR